jgi:hypothetical protein
LGEQLVLLPPPQLFPVFFRAECEAEIFHCG